MAILAITKSYGSGGSEIGRSIERLMGYEYISLRKIMEETKKIGGVWERFSSEYYKTEPNIWERHDWSFIGFMALVQSSIMNYAEQNNKVIMARGASALLKGIPHALRVRITAPIERRVTEVMKKEAIALETARLVIKEADRSINGAMSRLYGERWKDSSNFDLMFDSQETSIDTIVEVIKAALLEKEKLNTDDARRLLHLHAVAAKIKAGIVTNPSFLVPTLEVHVEGNAIVLRGVIHSPKEQNEIEKEAVKLAPYIRVNFDFRYRGSW